jgi:hypothetical protein
MKRLGLLILSGIAISLAQPALAEPTNIVVHVIAKGAKFVGTAMGGAEVTLSDADSGEVLARGLTAGGTGSTPNIMTTPHIPGDVLSDEDAARFETTIDIDRPRKITATVTGPMDPSSSAMTVTSTQWVLPGKHVSEGDAWLIELRGFAIAPAEGMPHEVSLDAASHGVPLTVKVTMMCGCPLTPGGMWDADKVEVGAVLMRDGDRGTPVELSYAGEASTFSGELAVGEPGNYIVEVYAYDPTNGNTGLQQIPLVVD